MGENQKDAYSIENVLIKIVDSLDSLKKEIKQIKEDIKANETLNKALIERVEKVESLYEDLTKGATKKELAERNQRKLKTENQQIDALEEEMLDSLEKKRKEVIKMKIFGLMKSNTMSLTEIRKLIVDKLGYCSKATFYRYIRELSPLLKEKEVYK
ncbi:MAG: hypothetical protein PWQ87_240 [Candidatus Woesearchaeota archaeon]|nr:hypothetical protein [Candidatus Woesearchaeota archaeon]